MTTARPAALTGSMALLWTAVLGAAALFGSYAFACVFPFAAIGAVAALTLDARRGAALIAVVWAVNQVVGFAFRQYPHTFDTVAWGIAIGVAAFAGYGAARFVAGGRTRLVSPRALGALMAAFLAYEGVLFAYALVAGGLDTFAPRIVASISANDAMWFAGLVALRVLMGRIAPLATARARVLRQV